MLSRLIKILSLLFLALPSFAQSQVTIGDFRYSVNGNAAVLTRYTGKEKEVTVPSTINYNGSVINVTTIDGTVFFNSKTVRKINIPASINTIGSNPFNMCVNLQEIEVSPDNGTYVSIDGVVYTKDRKTIVVCPGKMKSFSIPETVEHIADAAFMSCVNLTKVHIPSTVKTMGINAFRACEKLKSIEIPSSIKRISETAFLGCGLVDIKLNPGLECIGEGAFQQCDELVSIKIPEGVKVLEKHAFVSNLEMTEISLPSTLEKIGDNALSFTTKTIYLNAAYPVEGEEIIDPFYCSSIVVYVPQGSLQYYKQSEYWKKFNLKENNF